MWELRAWQMVRSKQDSSESKAGLGTPAVRHRALDTTCSRLFSNDRASKLWRNDESPVGPAAAAGLEAGWGRSVPAADALDLQRCSSIGWLPLHIVVGDF